MIAAIQEMIKEEKTIFYKILKLNHAITPITLFIYALNLKTFNESQLFNIGLILFALNILLYFTDPTKSFIYYYLDLISGKLLKLDFFEEFLYFSRMGFERSLI